MRVAGFLLSLRAEKPAVCRMCNHGYGRLDRMFRQSPDDTPEGSMHRSVFPPLAQGPRWSSIRGGAATADSTIPNRGDRALPGAESDDREGPAFASDPHFRMLPEPDGFPPDKAGTASRLVPS